LTAVNFYYVDDSGDEHQDLLAAIEVPAEAWKECLRLWLSWRKWLYKRHYLPTDYELHGSEFVEGRGNPVPTWVDDAGIAHDPPLNTTKGVRREIYWQCLRQIARSPNVRILTIHQAGVDKMAIYHDLLGWIQQELAAAGRLGVVVVDGVDPNYRKQHRELDLKERLIVEDVWMKDSAHCQFIQMADLAVHAAFQAVVQNPDKNFMWDWYKAHVGPIIEVGSAHPLGIRGLDP
jgi:hypothetical protein